jgi:chromosome segregation ATPase
MITLEQIRILEKKVTAAVQTIENLKNGKQELEERVAQGQKRIEELESLLRKARDDQEAIEKGILSALDTLDQLEDDITGSAEASPGLHVETDDEADEVIVAEDSVDPDSTDPDAEDPDDTELDENEEGRELDIF